jgi:hypothetical protein
VFLLGADRKARALKAALERVVIPLSSASRSFVGERGWKYFGYARIDDHARERFGRSGRWARDLRALANALDDLPGLAAALTGADGGKPIGRAAALLVGRIATAQSVSGWIAFAREVTVRELKDAVREARAAGSCSPSCCAPETNLTASPSSASNGSTDAVDRRGKLDSCTDDSDAAADRRLVELPAPPAVRVAFDETLDLYRAVEGGGQSATSFVEALVAEACSGPHPPGASQRPLRSSRTVARLEAAMAEATRRWSHLDRSATGPPPHELLSRLGDLEGRAGRGSPSELDAQVRELVALEEAIERELGALLARMAKARAWLHLHFAGVGHYAEERLGLSRTQAQVRARVARRLREHPVLRAAYEDGRLGLEATAVVLRILRRAPSDPELEAAWLAHATGITVKRLRDECRALGRAASCSEAGAAPREAGGGPEATSPGPAPLRDADWVASLRRDRGTASRRIREFAMRALSMPATTEMLRLRLPESLADDFLCAVEESRCALATAAESAAGEPIGADGAATPALLAARLCSSRSLQVPAWVGLLGLLEEFVGTWDPEGREARLSREAIYARDGWRCMAPGCTSRRNLEDHHLVYRSHRGSNDESNRICLCRFHHRQGEHGELATCRGEAPLDVVWTLGRHAIGGTYRNERMTRA